ncbi:probable LRR receptor-like serine/threonine-protein kinase At3g47570 [Quercus robur]|uniref:probable LRR receptor-like serine/threonine-protein kinase At3g47570 n=1 Tax=Quercus robur TaxID=38942 RepID=UPI0021629577|nr:probable LRR receptor-like serine/threonine-protein kinase At3g47570 [Quercus robur]
MRHFHFSLMLFILFFQIFACYSARKVGGIDSGTETEVLLSFKSLVSDPQNALSGWNISYSHCTWFGVNCTSSTTKVQSLHLSSLGLFGIIPPQLSNLTSLKTLDLSNNSFFGQIPSELGHLTSLQHIILVGNIINGTIPISLSHCRRLETIMFRNNKLTGHLPRELGRLHRLKVLDASMNNLTGAIPSTFGNLSTLTVLNMSRTQIYGEIPNELGRLNNLVTLQLSENQLSGEIPFSIFNISSLKFLSLTLNRLVGKLPSNIGLTLPKIRDLRLASNHLEGPIPSSLSNASYIEHLDLSSNNFTGHIPLLGNLKHLVQLLLGANSLSSTTKLNFQVFDSLTNCTLLSKILLNSNQLAGELPPSVANLSVNLQHFCVYDNFLTGSFPQRLEKYQNLVSLSIEKNFFEGKIPNSIGKLQKLERLMVTGNLFSGEIPDIFSNLTWLYELDMASNRLSGRIPMSIATCQRLEMLVLQRTALSGSIPKQIFELPQLKFLLLANNSLSGFLPDEFGHLRQLEFMDISGNQLSGNIPAITERYSILQYLNIARNRITGSIPKSLENLAALESLDLSSNNLSGLIPTELENLNALQMLNLSFNSLEGEVPKNGVFANISWDSLQGNKQLCVFDHETAEKLRVTTCVTKTKSNSDLVLKVIIPTSSFIVLVCASCLVCAVITKKKRKTINNQSSSSELKGLPPRLSYSEIQLATNGFDTKNLIGRGAFGSVYRAVFSTGESGIHTTVAVKVLDLTQSKASKSFVTECEALRNIRHRNLVKVFTSCSSIDHTGAEFKALAMEFMSNGNLDKWLYPEDVECGSTLTLTQRLNIAIDVASALDYLHHDCDPPVVHCDLKPGNVLLDEDMTAHVGDFGLARFLSHDSSQTGSSTIGLKGSIGYIAPEYGLGGKASTSGDVYSFGILLLEMIIAKKPTDGIFQEGLSINKFISEVHESKILDIADPKLFKDNESFLQNSSANYSSGDDSSSKNKNNIAFRGEECVASMVRVGLSCAADSSKGRFTMREALSKLQEIKRCSSG